MIILIAKLDEQFENFKSPRQREQINEENVGKKMTGSMASDFIFLLH